MKKHTEVTKTRIHKTTLNLIKLYGIKGWNMDMLCLEVNIAKDTLYRIIKSKEKLLTDMVDEILSEHENQVDEIIKSNQEFNLVLGALSKKIAKLLAEFGSLQLRSLFKEYPSIEENVNEYALRFDQKVSNFLKSGIESCIIKEKVDTELIAKSVRYMSIAILNEDGNKKADERISEYINYILEGIKINRK